MKSLSRLWHNWKWWTFVVLLTADLAVVGYLIGPPRDREPTPNYEVSNTLVLADPAGRDLTVERVVLGLERGPVPVTAARLLGFNDTVEMFQQVDLRSNQITGTVEITTLQMDEARAIEMVSVLSDIYLASRLEAQELARSLEYDQIQIDKLVLEDQIAQVDVTLAQQLAASSAADILARESLRTDVANGSGTSSSTPEDAIPQQSSIDVARRQALVNNYGTLLLRERELDQPASPDIFAAGDPVIEETLVGGFSTPLTPLSMAFIGGIVGLGLAIGVVALAYRLSDRVDDRDEAEAAYGATVLSDIPRIPRRQQRRSDVVTFDEPDAPASASYRHLRTMMSAISRQSPNSDSTPVYLVTSSHSAEGKTTIVANLAAAFSDSGEDVIVISGDLRRPFIHQLLGAPPDAVGILDVPIGASAEQLEGMLTRTNLPRVRLLAHGEPVNNPGELLASRLDVIARCRDLADVVIIDAPPALVGNDVAEMLPATDHVLVAVRNHITKMTQARATRRLLRSLGADIVGIALVESEDDTRRGYRYGSRTKTSRSARIATRLGRRRGEHLEAPMPEPVEVMAVEVMSGSNGYSNGTNGANGTHHSGLDSLRPNDADDLDTVDATTVDDIDVELSEVLSSQAGDAWTRHRTR